MALEDLTYRDYWQILKRRWAISVLGAGLGLAAGLGAAKVQTPKPVYEGLAVVRFDPLKAYEISGNERPSGDPMATQIIFMRSASVIGNVAKKLHLIPEDTARDALDPYAPVLAKLLARIDVFTDPKGRSGMILIRTRGHTPEEAAELATLMVAAYREENIFELKKDILKRREFIDRKLSENEQGLNVAQLAYERFRREHPEASIEPGMQGVISNVARSEAIAQALGEKIRETRRQLVLVRSGRPPSDIGLQMIVGATATSRLQQLSGNYTRLNLQKNALLTELTEAHPAVLQKDEQLASLRSDIEDELDLILDAFQKQQDEETARLEEMRVEEQSLPEEAMQLAQLARKVKVFENIQLQLRSQLEDALIKEAGVTGQVSVVSAAAPPTTPSNAPNFLRFGGVGAGAGFFLAFLVAVLIESSRFTLRVLRDVEEVLDLPVLGIVGRVTSEQLSGWAPGDRKIRRDSAEWTRSLALATLLAPRSNVGEAFRTLRASLQPRIDSGMKAFTLTAAGRSEGITTAAMNLALSFAQSGERVLLVESDFRNPTISTILGLTHEPGLANLLLGSCGLEEATRSVADFVTGKLTLDEILLGPGLDLFHVMPCGDRTGNTGELLASEAFAAAVDAMQSRYDLVFFDSPSLAVAADAITLGRRMAVILVYDPAKAERSDLETALDHLRKAECKVMGLFVNGMEIEAVPTEEDQPTEPAQAAV